MNEYGRVGVPWREHLPWYGLLILAWVAAMALAWHFRYMQDDAFISFAYSRSLAEGQGLTWFGTRVEGFTDPLWVVMVSAGIGIGAEPVLWSQTLGVALFGVALLGMWRLSRQCLSDPILRLAACAMFVSNYSCLSNATGGLDTSLVVALLTLFAARVTEIYRGGTSRVQVSLAVAVGLLAVLARMDSAVVVLVLSLFAIKPVARSSVARFAGGAVVAASLVLVAGIAWRYLYYGKVLPNTYYVKIAHDPAVIRAGVMYVARFLDWYMIGHVAAVAVFAALIAKVRRARTAEESRVRTKWIAPLCAAVGAYFCYAIYIGGDFMEFRLLVHVAPLLFVGLTSAITWPFARNPTAARVVAGVALAILISASVHHARTFREISDDKTLDSISALSTCYGLYPDGHWQRLGDALANQLGGSDTTVATSASGAIPFYSRIKTVDMCGLNDPIIPIVGNRAGPEYLRPGHRLAASQDYLREAGVHLIVGHPLLVPRGALAGVDDIPFWSDVVRGMAFLDSTQIGSATLVAMPVDQETSLVMRLLNSNPVIDARCAAREWEVRRLIILDK